MEHFFYFMIRMRRDSGMPGGAESDPMSGVVEQLGSGEKRRFANIGELLLTLAAWTEGFKHIKPTSDQTPADA